jgi:predicted extracellular nuclease
MKNIKILILCVLHFALCNELFAENTIKLTWPDDFKDASQYDGKLIELNQTLYVTDISNWNKYGEITLSSKRLMSPTEVALPGSNEYKNIVAGNESDQLILSDGSNKQYPNPRPWTGDKDYIRTGAYTNKVVGRFTIENYGYTITPTEIPVFEGNERPTEVARLGDYDVKVCSFNLQIYIVTNWDGNYGPATEAEANKQHTKIVKALASIDADVFGLVEVQQGQLALEKLANALNEIDPSAQYTYINDGTQVYGTYTKAGYLYKASKVKPLRQLQSNNTGVKHRKKAQGFEVLATGEKFVYMINHFKAKSGKGSGDNADTEDGQGAYNGDRVREATAVVTFAKSCATYFDDEDVLIMGDLNAYSMEDPIRIFTDEGYTNLIKKFEGIEGYSYSYQGTVGCLDHALANEEMNRQVTGCKVFHINADEAAVFGYDGYSYQNNMYRSSDHDPVVVGLRLGTGTSTDNIEINDSRIIYGGEGIIGIAAAKDNEMRIYSVTGQLIYSDIVDSNDFVISTTELGLKDGIYIVKLTNNDNCITEKLKIRK